MRNLLRDLSLIGKVISGVLATGIVPGATPLRVILLYIVVAIFKDVADNFYNQVVSYVGTLKQATPTILPEAQAPKAGAPASTSLPLGSQARAALLATLVVICFTVAGCSTATAPTTSTTTNAPSATTVASNAPAAPTVSDLQKFADTVNNVVQTVNTGAEILSPDVAKAATLAQLVVHGTQETAILDKIVAVSTAVSSAGATAGLPAPVVQAQVNATLTPAAAAAIVQQVVATTPTASN